MGLLHAAYGASIHALLLNPEFLPICIGAGALCAPLVATQFAQMKHWSYHYLVSLSIATINTIVQIAVFRFENQDGTSSFV
jgi:hypothetical protein